MIANGHRVGRKVHGGLATTPWRADEPMVPYLAFFAAGDFVVDRRAPPRPPRGTSRSRSSSPSATQRRVDEADEAVARRIVAWLEDAARRLPVLDHRWAGRPGCAAASRWRTRPGRRTQPSAAAQRRDSSSTSWPTSGSATRSRSQNWGDIWLNEGFGDVHGGALRRDPRRPVGARPGCAAATTSTAPRDRLLGPRDRRPAARERSIFAGDVYDRGGDDAAGAAQPDRRRRLLDGCCAPGSPNARAATARPRDFEALAEQRQRGGPRRLLRRLAAHRRAARRHRGQRAAADARRLSAAAPTGRSRSPRASRTRRCRRRPPAVRAPRRAPRLSGALVDISTVVAVEQHDVRARPPRAPAGTRPTIAGSSTSGSKPTTVPSGSAVTADFRCSTLADGYADHAWRRAASSRAASWSTPGRLVRPPSPTQTVPPCLSTSPPSRVPGASIRAIR